MKTLQIILLKVLAILLLALTFLPASGQINRYTERAPVTVDFYKGPDATLMYQMLAERKRQEEQRQYEAFKREYAGKVHLYGGIQSHDTYLGCLNCPPSDVLSIWNPHGDYGKNAASVKSANIWYAYGTFGSKRGNHSPWYSSANSPPVIVDFYGDFYGYFTRNSYYPKRTTFDFFLYMLDNLEMIERNYTKFGSFFYSDGSFDANGWNSFVSSDAAR